MCNKSESIKEIATALANFNGEVSKISKDAKNPFFKNNYATLDNIVEEVRPILTKYGLSILQFPGGDGENVIMKTMLLHESGEWIESDPLIMKPVKNDPQAFGSCVTYARRYSLNSFLSLNTGEDDDGNKASHGDKKPMITPKLLGEIKTKWLALGYKESTINAQTHKIYKSTLQNLTEDQAKDFLNKLNESKEGAAV
jgi:hypothetical protein